MVATTPQAIFAAQGAALKQRIEPMGSSRTAGEDASPRGNRRYGSPSPGATGQPLIGMSPPLYGPFGTSWLPNLNQSMFVHHPAMGGLPTIYNPPSPPSCGGNTTNAIVVTPEASPIPTIENDDDAIAPFAAATIPTTASPRIVHVLPQPRLSYSLQFKILRQTQELLERAAFAYSTAHMPDLLAENNWTTPEAVEISQWTWAVGDRCGDGDRSPFRQIDSFWRAAEHAVRLRDAAVHRHQFKDVGELLALLDGAVTLVDELGPDEGREGAESWEEPGEAARGIRWAVYDGLRGQIAGKEALCAELNARIAWGDDVEGWVADGFFGADVRAQRRCEASIRMLLLRTEQNAQMATEY